MQLLAEAYTHTLHSARPLAERLGLLNWLEARGREHHRALWLRTLFEIYRVEGLVALDLCWWTFAAQDAVAAHLAARPGARVFEYGSGASTVWLARRAAEVHSVEHDLSWAEVMRMQLADVPNVRLRAIPPTPRHAAIAEAPSGRRGYAAVDFADYVREIDEVTGTFDLIVIDGRSRAACLDHAHDRLAPDGLIVFDDPHRARYRAALASCNLDVRHLRGLKPCLPYRDGTALLCRPGQANHRFAA
ncbi:class I SAM-dependent methyltransferase [Roseovarius sp. B08]|uniref:class I SAM-dependent methyltransferase n=1 Tax=Roseovarius sp. B08 TaxID=3449223 RepID=UPI003EDBC52B